MIDSDSEVKELGRGIKYNPHNTRSLIRTLKKKFLRGRVYLNAHTPNLIKNPID